MIIAVEPAYFSLRMVISSKGCPATGNRGLGIFSV